MTKTLSATEKQRATVFSEMPAALQKVATELDTKASREATGVLTLLWDIGNIIRQVIEKEAEYGSNAVKLLAAYRGESEGSLYNRRNLAVSYTRDEIKELAGRQMANGQHITDKHLIAVMRVEDKEARAKIWNEVFAKSISANELMSQITAGLEKKNRRSGGRKPSKPSSVMGGIQQILSSAKTFNNRLPVWQESVFDVLDTVEEENVTPVLVEKISAAEEQLTALEGNLQQIRTRFDKNKKRVDEIAKRQAAQQAAAEKENKADEKKLSESTKPSAKTSKKPTKKTSKKPTKKTSKKPTKKVGKSRRPVATV